MWLNNLTQILKKFWKAEDGYVIAASLGLDYARRKNKVKQSEARQRKRDAKVKKSGAQITEDNNKRINKEFEDWQASRQAKRMEQGGSDAFKKLSDIEGIQQRQAELSQTARSGLSLQQKQAEKAQVGAAIRGQQKSISRRMQSVLGGQGLRGAASSSVMRSIDQKAKKQSAQFEMGQMARSYAEKQKAADKKATMGMDIKQFDIGQDKAKLEFTKSQKINDESRRSNIMGSLMASGKSSGISDIMSKEILASDKGDD
tara:strand:- start:462 stop:1235 length:774 start_codon:yes stop_codon:yes gene_type:complete